jgi:hypothetical protein
MRNNRGLNVDAQIKQLIVPTGEVFNATRILESQLRVGTANNDINAIKMMGVVPEVAVMRRLSDADAYFFQTDVPEGLMSMWRREVSLERDNDFDTENAKAKATMRFSAGSGDWRSVYGAAGAG